MSNWIKPIGKRTDGKNQGEINYMLFDLIRKVISRLNRSTHFVVLSFDTYLLIYAFNLWSLIVIGMAAVFI